MKRIYKYELKLTDIQVIAMPEGAEILSVQQQGENLQLWALVDVSMPDVQRKIRIIGTGNPVANEILVHISTFQMHGGALVFHAFESL